MSTNHNTKQHLNKSLTRGDKQETPEKMNSVEKTSQPTETTSKLDGGGSHNYTIENSSVSDILLNLKIIGAIKKSDRLSKNTDDIFEIECNDMFQGVRRWWKGQNRNDAIKGIKKIITSTFEITDKTLEEEQTRKVNGGRPSADSQATEYFVQDPSSLLQRFTIEMEHACIGLENLKSTYQTDVRVMSEINIMIEQLRLRIEKINKILTIDLPR